MMCDGRGTREVWKFQDLMDDTFKMEADPKEGRGRPNFSSAETEFCSAVDNRKG